MKESDKILKLLEKYDLTSEIPESAREHMEKNLKPSLAKILRERKSYGLSASVHLSVKILARRLGIRAQSTGGRGMKLAAACAAALVVLISFYSLKDLLFKKVSPRGQMIVLSKGSVDLMEKNVPVSAKINQRVPDTALIKTGRESHIFFRNGGISLTGVMENSEAKILSRSPERGSVMELRRGLLLARVDKLLKNQSYIIRTPNSESIVRGTAFSVRYRNGLTEVALASGKILLRSPTGGEKILGKGETAVISDIIEIRKISRIELLTIEKIRLLKFPGEEKTGGTGITDKQANKYERELERIDKQIRGLTEDERKRRIAEEEKWKRLPPLERLRKQGRFISMFHMSDGSRIAGSIVSQTPGTISLDTGDGIIEIFKKEIVRRKKIE